MVLLCLGLSGCNTERTDTNTNTLPEKLRTIDDTKLLCSQSIESFFFNLTQTIPKNVDVDFLDFYDLSLEKFNNLSEDSQNKLLDSYAQIQEKTPINKQGDDTISFWDKSWGWTKSITKQTYDDIAEILQDSDSNLVYSDFEILKPYWNLSEDDLKKLAERSHRQLESVSENIGSPLKQYEFVMTKTAGASLVQHSYMVKFDSTAIRYVCVFYKPEDTWYVHSVNWDNLVSLLFN
ncbi:hypothetical protein [Aliiglaciecola lipolytica]|uniref:hypothetical protein n=1 Tax=Aliiglaciecola lipolytica TaxID=477689 RepID=UPI0013755A0F|nr:hypothetical protein [Aliiglaciecola lipolytica]